MIKKKKYNYCQTYQLMTECGYNAAFELMRMLKGFDPKTMDSHLQKMHRLEHESDMRRHEIMAVLAKDYRPIIEREDIVRLSNALDDVVDMVEDVSIGLYIYNVESIPEAAMAYGKVIVMCCDAVREMLRELERFEYNNNVMDCIKRVNHLEGEGDLLFAKTTRELFQNEKDPIEVIRWKSIYDRMEKACDACEEVGHLVESIILKNS